MASKRRKIVAEDFDLGYGATTIPTDSGGTRAATKTSIDTFYGDNYIWAAAMSGATLDVQLNAAVAALPTTGGVIDCRGIVGAQTIAATITLSKPIHLIFGSIAASGSADPMISVTSSDCKISGQVGASVLTSTAAASNCIKIAALLSNVHIDDVELVGPGGTFDESARNTGNGIWVAGSIANPFTGTRIRDISITGCLIREFKNNGILLTYCEQSRIEGNSFSNTNAGLAQVSLHSTNSTTMVANTHSCATSSDMTNAYYILALADQPSTYNVITNNAIEGPYKFECINVFGSYNTVSHNTIKCTNTTSAASAGIDLVQPAGSDTACSCHHNSCIGNVITMSGTAHAQGIGIKDNGSSGNFGSNDHVVQGNVLTNCGIIVNDYCSRLLISGNRVDTNTATLGDCIYVGGASCVRNIVTDNIVNGSARHGIHMNTGVDCVVSHNISYSNTENGILIVATRPTAIGNKTLSNTLVGIDFLGSTAVLQYGNQSSSNGTNYGTGATTEYAGAGQQLIFDNTKGILVRLAAGGDGAAILYRQVTDEDVILRNSEASGGLRFRTGGDIDRITIDSNGRIRLWGQGASPTGNAAILTGDAAPAGAEQPGTLYIRTGGAGPNASLYVSDGAVWYPFQT